jgi:hypothetical protein
MSKHVRSIVASFLTVLALSRPAVAQSGEEFEEFKELMASAEQQYGHVEFHSKWIHYKPTGELRQRDQLDGLMAGPCCVTEQTTEYPPRGDATPRGGIQGSNSRYRFVLTRKADAYVLTEMTAPYNIYQPWQCSFAVPITPDTYHGILGRADTRVVSRSEVVWRGRPHTEWVLDTTTGAWQTCERFKARIGLFVRPDRPGMVCGIRRYDAENPTQWLTETVVEYEADGGPWPAPVVIEEWVADKTEWLKDKSATYKPWRAVRHEFSLWRRLPPGSPGKEFTLSHYNLPEPKHVPTAISPGVPGGVSEYVPPAIASENGPASEWLFPLAVPGKVATDGVWPWLTIGLILVLAALALRWSSKAGWLGRRGAS